MEMFYLLLFLGVFILLEIAFKKLFGISLLIVVLLVFGLNCG